MASLSLNMFNSIENGHHHIRELITRNAVLSTMYSTLSKLRICIHRHLLLFSAHSNENDDNEVNFCGPTDCLNNSITLVTDSFSISSSCFSSCTLVDSDSSKIESPTGYGCSKILLRKSEIVEFLE